MSTNKILAYTDVEHSESVAPKLVSAIKNNCSGGPHIVHKHYTSLRDGEKEISREIQSLTSSSPNVLILIHGTDNAHSKRSMPLEPHTTEMPQPQPQPQPQQPQRAGSVFDHYAFFSPTTVLVLGISAFLIFFALNALWIIGTTETPDRLGQMSRTAREKKQQ